MDKQALHKGKAGKTNPENLEHGFNNLSPLAQLRRMQRVLFERTQDEETDDKVISAMACAWERLEARKAAITMKPAPKPVDTLLLAKTRRSKAKANESSFSDPTGPVA